jgi:hypothetical protein
LERAFYITIWILTLGSSDHLSSSFASKNQNGEELIEPLFPLSVCTKIFNFDMPFLMISAQECIGAHPCLSTSRMFYLYRPFTSRYPVYCFTPKSRKPISVQHATGSLLDYIFEFCNREKVSFYIMFIVPKKFSMRIILAIAWFTLDLTSKLQRLAEDFSFASICPNTILLKL